MLIRFDLVALCLWIAWLCGTCAVAIAVEEGTVPVVLPDGQAAVAIDRIPIPAREHGYKHLDTQLINDAKQMEQLLALVASQVDWNQSDEFVRVLKRCNVNFDVEVVILVRHEEGSGSIKVACGALACEGGNVVVGITRQVPMSRTLDMAYYCFGYVVQRDQIRRLRVRGSSVPGNSYAPGITMCESGDILIHVPHGSKE